MIDQLIPDGAVLWFEYHCNESPESLDAPAWFHSHQQVTVLNCVNADEHGDLSFDERCYAGHQLVYRCRFTDGLEWDVFEDELLESPEQFERPDPPQGDQHDSEAF